MTSGTYKLAHKLESNSSRLCLKPSTLRFSSDSRYSTSIPLLSMMTLVQYDQRKVFERQITFVNEGASKHLRRAYKHTAPAGASVPLVRALGSFWAYSGPSLGPILDPLSAIMGPSLGQSWVLFEALLWLCFGCYRISAIRACESISLLVCVFCFLQLVGLNSRRFTYLRTIVCSHFSFPLQFRIDT